MPIVDRGSGVVELHKNALGEAPSLDDCREFVDRSHADAQDPPSDEVRNTEAQAIYTACLSQIQWRNSLNPDERIALLGRPLVTLNVSENKRQEREASTSESA